MIEKNFDFGNLVAGADRKRWCRTCAVPHLEGTPHEGDPQLLVAQPTPKANGLNHFQKAIWDLVVDDMIARHRQGVKKYGAPLIAFNGRDALADAYQNALDLTVYLRQALEERTDEKLEIKNGTKGPGLGRTKRARAVPRKSKKPRGRTGR
jgi:hypothetical protein